VKIQTLVVCLLLVDTPALAGAYRDLFPAKSFIEPVAPMALVRKPVPKTNSVDAFGAASILACILSRACGAGTPLFHEKKQAEEHRLDYRNILK
jgi:hypothetical protein